MSYDFSRLLDSKLSMNERPLVMMWSISAGGAAEAVFLTCLEQFKQSPSKAKVKAIFEWLVDQGDASTKSGWGKGDGHWGSMNLESDGVSNSVKQAAATISANSKYYIARKSWWGKRSAALHGNLGNSPAPNMFDGLIGQAVSALNTVTPSFGGWTIDKLDRQDSYIVSRLKGMEYMNNAFQTAGFNTAAIGIRLPFKFR